MGKPHSQEQPPLVTAHGAASQPHQEILNYKKHPTGKTDFYSVLVTEALGIHELTILSGVIFIRNIVAQEHCWHSIFTLTHYVSMETKAIF